MRGATWAVDGCILWQRISTHTPHARCDFCRSLSLSLWCISTHTPHARCDLPRKRFTIHRKNFYSHTSCEVRPLSSCARPPTTRNFYSHTSCEVRPSDYAYIACRNIISTHTPHARCDGSTYYNSNNYAISTHTPHARCDILASAIAFVG